VTRVRVLGVDFGTKRIGLAVGESEFGIISTRNPLAASGALAGDADAIVAVARKEMADAIVLGVPVQAEGLTDKMAGICRQLAERIRERGMKVYTVDEALSSVQAEGELIDSGMKAARRKRVRDAEAARIILERFFDGQTDL
jgi:putative holliday junction resolvase